MAIDGNTLRCLEVHRTLRTGQRSGSLLSCVDKTCTGMGARLLERWLTFPLVNYSAIVARQDAVAFFLEDRRRLDAIRKLLGDCTQIDRVSSNIAMGRVRPRELVALGRTIEILPELARCIGDDCCDLVAQFRPHLLGLDEAGELIGHTIDTDCPNVLRDGGVIAAGFDEELDRLRRVGAKGQSWLADYQRGQSRETGIPLKVGYNRVFGYYIEISNVHRDKAPANYIRKQTLKNAERYITDELKKYESEVLTAAERAKDLENRLYEQVRLELVNYLAQFQAAAEGMDPRILKDRNDGQPV